MSCGAESPIVDAYGQPIYRDAGFSMPKPKDPPPPKPREKKGRS